MRAQIEDRELLKGKGLIEIKRGKCFVELRLFREPFPLESAVSMRGSRYLFVPSEPSFLYQKIIDAVVYLRKSPASKIFFLYTSYCTDLIEIAFKRHDPPPLTLYNFLLLLNDSRVIATTHES